MVTGLWFTHVKNFDYLDFEAAKNIVVPEVLSLAFGGHWRFLTGVLHLDVDLDMVTGL